MRRLRNSAAAIAAAWLALLPLPSPAGDAPACSIPQPASRPFASAQEAADSPEGRNDLTAWEQDQAKPLPPESRLRGADVAGILAGIERAPPRVASWWERLLARLDAWLQRHAKDAAAPAWLRDLLGAISPEAIKTAFWIVLCLLVIGLGGIVIMELRAAGHAARRPGRRRVAGAPDAAPAASARVLSLAEITALSPLAQPAALLRLAIASLTARQLLPPDESLTNRELLGALAARAPAETAAFGRLARSADAAIYGGRAPPRDEVAVLVAAVRALQGAGA